MTEYQVYYFGMIAERTTCDKEVFSIEKRLTVNQLDEMLQQKYPMLKNLSYKIAVDKNFVPPETIVSNNQEIALLPPFAGG